MLNADSRDFVGARLARSPTSQELEARFASYIYVFFPWGCGGSCVGFLGVGRRVNKIIGAFKNVNLVSSYTDSSWNFPQFKSPKAVSLELHRMPFEYAHTICFSWFSCRCSEADPTG
jgi:hypothetical protein